MIFAVYVKTESCDSTLILKDVNTETEMLAEILLIMGDEFPYVCEWEIDSIGGDKDILGEMIENHIELMRDALGFF